MEASMEGPLLDFLISSRLDKKTGSPWAIHVSDWLKFKKNHNLVYTYKLFFLVLINYFTIKIYYRYFVYFSFDV
jgi:hypothetical protein